MSKSKTLDITMPAVYRPIIEKKNKTFLIKGGRISGKSKNAYILAILLSLNLPYTDILVARANYGDIETSSYNELRALINEYNLQNEYTIYKSPLRIVRRLNSGTIYFTGASGDEDRTKGFMSEYKVSIVIVEETQQLKNENELVQLETSLRRRLNINDWRMIYIFNPPAQTFHWINQYYKRKEQDKDIICLHTTYKDIWSFLNDIDKREILKDKLIDYNHYQWFYEGIPNNSGFGAVYSTFDTNLHFVKEGDWNKSNKYAMLREQIVGMIIGCDGSASVDKTALVPCAILKNGLIVVLNVFTYDPVESGQFGTHFVTQNFITQWFNRDICLRYNLNDRLSYVPILFVCDPAGSELAKHLRYFCEARPMTQVITYSKETQIEMADRVIGAFARNQCFVVDYGGYYDYSKQRFIANKYPLVEELTSVVWNKTGMKYDDTIPNDHTDALTYALGTWFRNVLNVNWLSILSKQRKSYYAIIDNANSKR